MSGQIQIIGYREYTDVGGERRSTTKFFSRGWRAQSVPALFKDLALHLADIPQNERYNIHYTVAQCMEERGRKMAAQEIIPFDIDEMDASRYEEYIAPVCAALGVKRDEIGLVFSGNGLHFLILLEEPFYQESYFEENRVYYKALCGEIDQALKTAGLPGKTDPAVFCKGRTLRLPGTENRKEKGVTQAFLIHGDMRPLDFSLRRSSGIPQVEPGQYMHPRMLENLPPADKEGVLGGCEFIKWCYDNQPDVSEPQWYALLSVLGRLPDGRDLVHEYSQGHPQYTEAGTDRKLQQALSVAGPRTCEGIQQLWDGCPKCPNFGKCVSPITLETEEHIRTKGTGFYTILYDDYGVEKKRVPAYGDLVRYFQQQHPACTHSEGRMLYVWRDGHWQDYPKIKVEHFAEKNFSPAPTNTVVQEFYNKLLRGTVQDASFFECDGVINFKNGVLDIRTKEFMPASPSFGFRYRLPFDYDPKAICPRFDQYLNEVTGNDPSVVTVLLEFMGYALCGLDPAVGQKALILTGEGANGKSVFLDVLKHMAGKNNYSTVSLGQEIANINNRYSLDGKLFNITEETPARALVDSSLFKALAAGGEIQAKKLYCDSYSMRTRAKIILACNEMPENVDYNYGFMRRLLLVPFNQTFTEANRDVDIRQKLYREASGIFNRAYAAALRFLEQGRFTESAQVAMAVEQYHNTNPLRQFCLESCMASPEAFVPFSDLYKAYRFWCEEAGLKAETKIAFAKRLGTGFPGAIRSRRKVHGKVIRSVEGYGLLTEDVEAF